MTTLAKHCADGTAAALRGGEFERARIILAIAQRAEAKEEERRLRAAFETTHSPETAAARVNLLSPLLELWSELAPQAQREASVGRLASRVFAFSSADDEQAASTQPFPQHARPTTADAEELLQKSFFKRDAERARQDAAACKSLLLPELSGASSCDLVAVLVQLILGAPFAPAGFAADMLGALLGPLRHATGGGGMQLDWAAVASLSERQLRRALRQGLDEDFFYEADARASSCWRTARAKRIHAMLQALPSARGARGGGEGVGVGGVGIGGGGASLDWLRPMGTWAALRALLALPGVTLPVASALLLYELQRPLLPVCTNALLELRANGWVPPHAGAAAAFLHLHARLPADAELIRAVYSTLCQQHAFRITRAAVVGKGGEGKPSPEDVAYRERRAAYAMVLPIRMCAVGDGAAAGSGGGAADDGEETHDDDDDDDDERIKDVTDDASPRTVPAALAGSSDGFVVAPDADSPAVGANSSLLPLELAVRESLHHHQLYPSAGCTPLLVALRPLDTPTAKAAAAALAAGKLPLQQAAGEGAGMRYMLDVPWSRAELEAAAVLVGGEDEGTVGASLQELTRGGHTDGAAGSALFGFGPLLESGLHLAAKCDRPGALRSLIAHSNADVQTVDARGQTPLHAACASRAADACLALIGCGAELGTADAEGRSPLALAAAAGSLSCVTALLDAGAALDTASAVNPLELAAGAGAIDVCTLLLERGAAVDAQSASGRTALHAAARASHLQVAKLLVDRGAAHLRDRTERLPHEHLSGAALHEGRWLVDAGKDAAKSSGKAAGKQGQKAAAAAPAVAAVPPPASLHADAW